MGEGGLKHTKRLNLFQLERISIGLTKLRTFQKKIKNTYFESLLSLSKIRKKPV